MKLSPTAEGGVEAAPAAEMEWNQGDLVWFDPGGLGHPLPGEIQEVHQAAQIIVVQAVINGKVNAGRFFNDSIIILHLHPPPPHLPPLPQHPLV